MSCTVIRFVWVSAKFGTCTVVSVNGTLVEDKMRRFKGECAHFSFNKCPIYTHDGASAKFSTNSHETDNSVVSTLERHSFWFKSKLPLSVCSVQYKTKDPFCQGKTDSCPTSSFASKKREQQLEQPEQPAPHFSHIQYELGNLEWS